MSSIRATLLRWYRENGRDLPWRHTHDPYAILISEIMLQQTQVTRVIPYYHRWLEAFPNWTALATAATADILKHWSGLGYNRRALALQRIAKHIVEHGEPTTRAGWEALHGIGPYTARAISAFAHGGKELPIDTNIRRVCARIFLGIAFPTLADDARITTIAEPELFASRSRNNTHIPQALFDLASSICTKSPQCAVCPLKHLCKTAPDVLAGNITIPKRSIAKAQETIREGKRYPDRIYRGRILALVQDTPQSIRGLGKKIDENFAHDDTPWLHAMISRMKKDGLLQQTGARIHLPK